MNTDRKGVSNIMEYEILEYGTLTEEQKKQAVEVFIEGFGHFMTFSKNEKLKRKLFLGILNSSFFKCYVEDGKVLGLLGIATNKERPLKFERELCIKYFGKLKGAIISKQMNGIFQKPVVQSEKELYIDFLVTGSKARRKGVGTALLNYAFGLKEYEVYSIEVFSNNQPAFHLYEKSGFTVEERRKLSPMRFLGVGYPIKMKKYNKE